MAEFHTVMKEKRRMCKQIGDCSKCPISFLNNKSSFCTTFMAESPEDAERIIMQWASKHPIMTNRRKFEEVFGKDLFKLCVEEPWGDVLKWLDEEYKGGDSNDS